MMGDAMQPTVKFKKLKPDAHLPMRASSGAACYDLFASDTICIDDMRTFKVIGTGIAIELPPGYVGLVCSRSGLASKYGIFVLNAPGVIDEDYRGELKVILGRLPYTPQWPSESYTLVEPGMRIAQLMIMPVTHLPVEEVTDLTTTARGEGGLGSTGV
jgi:dUTP pyrophosphatase